eukprot:CAMPEP_0116546778 /NCGR_PEP_ID=MMETSP0397-20121206/3409_1 /TAXON_ID=216820 /ORGANISM="Cyclophora tenuis, Strain ECT3854" /LENGTH=102 /DNA_ID=CAMNT_0004071233 /DNA_START=139 /DNA_END=447 /DNA_ORIENTATION=-
MAIRKPDKPMHRVPSDSTWDPAQALGMAMVSPGNGDDQYTMNQAHKYYTAQTTKPPYSYVWHKVHGFHETTLYARHGDPSSWNDWYTMNITDCNADKSRPKQ